MKHIVRKLAYHYKEGGIRGILRKTWESLLHRSWSENQWVLYVRDLTNQLPQFSESVARRELGLQELRNLGYFKAHVYPEAIARRFDSLNICYGFFAGDELATLGWTSSGYLELDRDLHFPCTGGIGLFDFFTVEEFRSRGYYTNALMQLAAVALHAGFTSAYVAVDPGNGHSVRGIERAGFRPVLCVTKRWRLGVPTIVDCVLDDRQTRSTRRIVVSV